MVYNMLACRCDGIGRRDGLKIYNAVSYHFGVNP